MFANTFLKIENKIKVLLSHRYGTRCLPTRILAKEYEILRKESQALQQSNEIDLSFEYESSRNISFDDVFQECYELDENEIPARFKLKFIERIIPNYNEKVILSYFLRVVGHFNFMSYILRILYVKKFGQNWRKNSVAF